MTDAKVPTKKHASKIVFAGSAIVIAGLVALAAPPIIAVLPEPVQVVFEGTIDTAPGTVDELFLATGLEGPGRYGDAKVTHAGVDHEYEIAASIWPWDLPPGFGFPKHRGAADTPGTHWNGMGVKAAFSKWATAALEAAKSDHLAPPLANNLLDEVEDAYRALRDEGVLSDRDFIAESVTPLRR